MGRRKSTRITAAAAKKQREEAAAEAEAEAESEAESEPEPEPEPEPESKKEAVEEEAESSSEEEDYEEEAEEVEEDDETDSASEEDVVEAKAVAVGKKDEAEASEEESEAEESDDESASGSGESDSEEEEEDDDAEAADDAEKDDDDAKEAAAPAAADAEESCTFDLRNLTALNPHQINASALYTDGAASCTALGMKSATIDVGATLPNEAQLMDAASDGCAQLLGRLWTLQMEKTDVGALATLPTWDEVPVPRALPPPNPKAETKWEKFAKEKGIAPKEKRSRKVWDEAEQSWGYRHGYERAGGTAKGENWPIMEVKDGDDPFDDPWEKVRDEKRGKMDKNNENRMRNLERGGDLAKGTATRTKKAQKKIREAGKQGGGATPSGVPIDLKGDKQRGKELTSAALLATQTSTASLGKFDRMREGEPERRKANQGLKKRKFESATPSSGGGGAKGGGMESNRNERVLKNVLAGGGKEKERAVRRGEFAKGETAYDHEYNDGLGASSFKKKKGRAGAGKARKMTKKRAK